MEENERQAKINAEKIIQQAKYRVSMKRRLRQSGIPSSLIRDTSTENLETLCGLSNILL